MSQSIKLMFVCTGNAFRSQMADGFARKYGGDAFEVFSCGVMASGVHPGAVKAMQELGIDISRHSSDVMDAELMNQMDCIVTVCDNAKEHCPHIASSCKVLHWSIPDPYAKMGTSEGESFLRLTRDDIAKRVKLLIEELLASS